MADIVYPGETPGGVLGTGLLPGNFDLVIYRGDYIPIVVVLKNPNGTVLDLTGYTGKASIRATYSDTVTYNFVISGSGAGGVLGTDGKVNITLPSSVSTTLLPGDYIWDFQLTEPGAPNNSRTYIAGDVKVHDEVTR